MRWIKAAHAIGVRPHLILCVNLCTVVSLCVRTSLRVFVCAFVSAVRRVCICPCVYARVCLYVRVHNVPVDVFVRVCAWERETDHNLVMLPASSDSAVVIFINERDHAHYTKLTNRHHARVRQRKRQPIDRSNFNRQWEKDRKTLR